MTHSATDHQVPHPPAIETVGLGKRYRRGWALRDSSFRLPAGRVCALVGPNGAGKTTLLSLAAGLVEPTTGTIRLAGHRPGSPEARHGTAFLSQRKALYPRFRVREILRMGQELNPSWHQETAEWVVEAGGIPMDARVGTLSGGQSTRVAFALALGKRPRLMLLDEPMADLDPLVRHQMTDILRAEARRNGSTVVMSSHLVSELSNACDYLVLVNNGRVRLAGEVDLLLDRHRQLTAAAADADEYDVIATTGQGAERATLVRTHDAPPPDGTHRTPTLEELVLGYLGAPDTAPLITPSARVSTESEVSV
ncbi:ABC transporter ATP-binding protein [Streptomyces sp. NPDC047841]|uniref:ABC transporter ATP-binding protein n=1 Tax=Streptomyces sp. NPDC047841 TaxID=3154708 RepID=UPI003454F71B